MYFFYNTKSELQLSLSRATKLPVHLLCMTINNSALLFIKWADLTEKSHKPSSEKEEKLGLSF